jgi:hypothetical protein
MTNKAQDAVTFLTQVAGAVGDVENTLNTAPSHDKKAAAMTALQDALDMTAKNTSSADKAQIKDTASKAVDLVVQLNNLLGAFHHGKSKHHPIAAKKSA